LQFIQTYFPDQVGDSEKMGTVNPTFAELRAEATTQAARLNIQPGTGAYNAFFHAYVSARLTQTYGTAAALMLGSSWELYGHWEYYDHDDLQTLGTAMTRIVTSGTTRLADLLATWPHLTIGAKLRSLTMLTPQ
jgi:hypothetical protein